MSIFHYVIFIVFNLALSVNKTFNIFSLNVRLTTVISLTYLSIYCVIQRKLTEIIEFEPCYDKPHT